MVTRVEVVPSGCFTVVSARTRPWPSREKLVCSWREITLPLDKVCDLVDISVPVYGAPVTVRCMPGPPGPKPGPRPPKPIRPPGGGPWGCASNAEIVRNPTKASFFIYYFSNRLLCRPLRLDVLLLLIPGLSEEVPHKLCGFHRAEFDRTYPISGKRFGWLGLAAFPGGD